MGGSGVISTGQGSTGVHTVVMTLNRVFITAVIGFVMRNCEPAENEALFSRKIRSPQLMVMDISSKSIYNECKKKMQAAEDKKTFNVSVFSSTYVEKDLFAASLIHHFPRKGGTVTYGDVALEYIPQPVPQDTMRLRLYVAYPVDRKELYNNICLQRVGLIGLMVQTFIAIELKVPMEERTMTSGTYVSISGVLFSPIFTLIYCVKEPQFTEMTPSVALLQLDKTAAELTHERHLAKYIRKRLSLLGQLDSNRLLHLVFLLTPKKIGGTKGKDKIETILDLSVIKSDAFYCMPVFASQVHSYLDDVAVADILPTHCCWRVMSWQGDNYMLRHTGGGTVASYLGAVVHEVGHLLKIPHTDSGIMCGGGENIQTFFMPLKKMNLGFMEKDFPQLQGISDNVSFVHVQMNDEFVIKRIMESLLDSTTKLLMTVHPLITHKPRKKMCQILYDEDTGVVEVESGIRYVLYYTNDRAKRMLSFTEQYMKKRLVLRAEKSAVRALIVTEEGNFLSVLVTNSS
uniref:Peptidase M12B domain-containing protein n=1 Tax=Setaria digitata TaxID=48799 RepID=A0A915PP50_9BILA